MNFGKAMAYPFQDPEWFRKILIGGLFKLASITGIFFFLNFFPFGYLVEVARQNIKGPATALPEWDQFGKKFGNGILMFLIFLFYSIVIGGIGALWIVFCATSDLFVTATMIIGIVIGSILIGIGVSLFGMVGTALFAAEEDFPAAFNVAKIWAIFQNDPLSFIILVWLGFWLNLIMFIIGLGIFSPFTVFWSQIVVAKLVADYVRENLPSNVSNT